MAASRDITHPKSRSLSARVKLGIVGLGNFGILHAETALHLGEIDLVALVDTSPDRLADCGSAFEGIAKWSDLNEALAQSQAEAWIVATSTDSHVSLARMILEAGHSVLMEKPIAPDLVSADSLRKSISDSGGRLMLGHVALFNSEFLQLQKEVSKRGPVQFIDCVRHRPSTTMDAFPGESPLHLTMVHDLYLTLALKNRVDPVSLSARTHHSADDRCDLVSARLQWADGSIASLTASFKTPAGMPEDGFDRIEVFGENWCARISPNPRPVEVWDNDRAHRPATLEIGLTGNGSATGMLAEQLRHFSGVVRGERNIPIGAGYEDGLQVQQWMEILSSQIQDSTPEKT